MTHLPDAPNRAWPKHAMRDLGGWIELAGGDPHEVFKSRDVDHPYIGLVVIFPMLTNAGLPDRGTVKRCLIHPQGELMYDVEFPEPVPSHLHCGGRWILHDRGPVALHRFRHSALTELARLPNEPNEEEDTS